MSIGLTDYQQISVAAVYYCQRFMTPSSYSRHCTLHFLLVSYRGKTIYAYKSLAAAAARAAPMSLYPFDDVQKCLLA